MSAVNHCAECGFLSLRNKQTGELVEAEFTFRRTGRLPSLARATPGQAPIQVHDSEPICFIRAFPISAGYAAYTEPARPEEHVSDERKADARKKLMWRARDCKESRQWMQGFSPKEHFEMMSQEAILADQRQRDELDRTWREKQSRQAAKDHRWNLAIVLAAALAAPILAYFLGRIEKPAPIVIQQLVQPAAQSPAPIPPKAGP